ncbi:MAG: Ribosome-associated heat shock protein implicated in the recycling of the 50S subunit (S4 paralog) [uncultured Thiotrichaceae bacterium]|uniref:Heat shock protein 15 n=1 Tax=uncultured Thiotrichaceae bacterium TaxID=298394 RepID=A0A6S6U8U1_9GAMM|nr:MAG: Ribosome-associated heat shock protein implicated in the recycling of the 50S subunit (S4 paralog) [uncultured Thiotrichaceae bacterium]
MASGNEALTSVRLDKWLWAARFFKQRQMAVEAITGGHIHVNGDRVKPARPIRPGDELRIRKGADTWVVTVLGLNDKRRPAKEAVLLYQEDEHHKEQREEQTEMRRLHGVNVPTRKPDKRERRKLGEFKQNWE